MKENSLGTYITVTCLKEGRYRTLRASTGLSKNPTSWGECGSSIMRWSAPDFCSMFATSLDVIGDRRHDF